MRRRRVEATIAPSFFDIQNKNMKPQTLYDKLWNSHIVREEEDGTVLLYIDRHLVH